MTNKELNVLHQALGGVGELQGIKFVYAVAKNNRKIEEELKVVQDVINKVPDIEKYREEITKLQKDTALSLKTEKDENKINDIHENANKEQEKLTKKYDKISSAVENIWKEKANIDLHTIKQSDLPENITAKQLTGITEIVED